MSVLIIVVLCVTTMLLESVMLLLVKDSGKWIKAGLLCNLITNPILNMILPTVYRLIDIIVGYPYGIIVCYVVLFLLEVGVVFFETWIFGFFVNESFGKRLKVACIINAFSFFIGLLLNYRFIEWFEDLYFLIRYKR